MLRFVRSGLLKSSALGLACCVLTAAVHADVYKYKDEKGNVLYTDKPMFLPAERISIKTETNSIVDLNQTTEAKKAPAASDAARKPATPEPAAAKDKTETAGEKLSACEKARQDYLSRMNAQRLYEEQPGGERRYLTETELDSSRSSAKQAMDAVCN